NPALSEGVKHAIQAARGQLVIEPALANIQGADRANAELILRASLADSVRWVMLFAGAIALGGGSRRQLDSSSDCGRQQRQPIVGVAFVLSSKPEDAIMSAYGHQADVLRDPLLVRC